MRPEIFITLWAKNNRPGPSCYSMQHSCEMFINHLYSYYYYVYAVYEINNVYKK